MAEVQFKVGINYAFLNKYYDPNNRSKQGFLLQGSGGSGKTWDVLQFLIVYSEDNAGKGKDILICRETYAACKGSVLKDFIKILKMYGMYDEKCHVQSHPQQYHHEGNTFSFAGRDDSAAHGARRDVIYFNEIMLDEDDKAFQQMNGRCAEMFICDYNPKFTEHWVYDKVKYRNDVKFFKSTFLTNKYLPQGERDEKLGYEPWHPEDRQLPEDKRRPHPTNIAQGTADEYLWRVYGMGEAAAAEGIIFQHATWLSEWPEGMGYVHCVDFGFTVDPCVIIKYNEDANNIWAECLSYQPMETAADIHQFAQDTNLNIRIPAIADSSDKHVSEDKGTVQMVADLKKLGWNIDKVSKTKSIMYWLTSMKKKKIHLIKNHYYKEVLKEKENYRMKTINGTPINQPVDKFNHFWDPTRYGHMTHNQPSRRGFW